MTDVKIEQLEELRELLAKATPGPWELETEPNEDGEYGSGPDPSRGYDDFMILGAEGGKILGTENATHKLIEEDHHSDEYGYTDAWDAIGKANAELAVAAINALPTLLDTLADLTRERDEALDDVRIWKGEAETRSQRMVELNLDRAGMGVEIMQLKEALAGAIDVMKPVVDCWGIGWRPDQVQEMIRAVVPLVAAQRAFIADREAV